ncbi:MAG TPA: class I adenylate-forming enzyme family protein, partial [Acidimicrobiales bacterium]|nr:class I adenylate-forming enzyme family protein [Acidimicrobiales bacterium]
FLDRLLGGDPARLAVATRTGGGWDEATYAELDRRAAAVAARLAAAGVAPGDRVVLAAPPGGWWVAALVGILRAGAVAVPLDPGLTGAERAPMLAASAPAAALDAAALDALAGAGALGGPGPEPVAARRRPGDPALIVWTSGTTGAPKGVTLTLGNVAYSVEQAMAGQRPTAADRWLSLLPAHHLLELCCGVLPALASGGAVYVARTLMAAEVGAVVRDRGITKMVAVPLVLRLLEGALAGSALEAVYCGGAPLDPAVVERYAGAGIAVYPGYGLTEAAPTVAMNTPAAHRPGSVGRPLAGTEARIGAGGEILVRSPGVMAGYWGDDALTAATVDAGGWLHTGDVGRLDGDGFLFVTGRAKRLVVLESGKKVQPEEVERALAGSDRFAEVCVVGVTARRRAGRGEQVCAVVVPSPAMLARHGDPGSLLHEAASEVAHRTAGLSGYKRPTVVKVSTAPLPRTLKGSPSTAEVARMVEEGRL